MSSKRTKGKETRKSKQIVSARAAAPAKTVSVARESAPRLAVKTAPAKTAPAKTVVKPAEAKTITRTITRPSLKEASKVALKEALKPERIHSHPTMCLHCHLIVEMFHERGADPVKGAWQCPRCGHKYLFSHWKIKRQARGKPEAA